MASAAFDYYTSNCAHGFHPHLRIQVTSPVIVTGNFCTNHLYAAATSGKVSGEMWWAQGASFPYICLAASATTYFYYNPDVEDTGGYGNYANMLWWTYYVEEGSNYGAIIVSEDTVDKHWWAWHNYFRDPDEHHDNGLGPPGG